MWTNKERRGTCQEMEELEAAIGSRGRGRSRGVRGVGPLMEKAQPISVDGST